MSKENEGYWMSVENQVGKIELNLNLFPGIFFSASHWKILGLERATLDNYITLGNTMNKLFFYVIRMVIIPLFKNWRPFSIHKKNCFLLFAKN